MSYIGKIPATGNFVKLDAISVVNGQAGYTMQSSSVNFTPESANHMLVSLNGVIQAPISSFTVSGSTITFDSALSTGDVIDFIMVYGNVLDIGTPSDNTVSTAKLVDTSVTAGKLATDSVIEAKIQNDAVTRDKINAISTSSLPSFEAKGDGTSDGYLQLNCSHNSHGIKLKSPPHSASASYTLTFPNNDGNANEILTTDGSGVLSWGTVSSDFVKLSSTTPSPANTFSIDGFFTADYDVYKIYAIGMSGSSMSNTRLSYKMNVSGSAVTGYTYSTVNNSGSTLSIWADNTNASQMDAGYLHNSSGSTAQGNLEMLIYRPLSTDQTTIIHQMTAWDNGTTFGRYFGASADKTARAISGITLGVGAFGSGNIEADRILVYGLKI